MAVRRTVPPKEVERWIERMAILHPTRAKSAAACGRLLGLSPQAMQIMRENGCDKRTALAMRAVIHCMTPWGS